MNRNLKTAAAVVFMGSAVLLAGCSPTNAGPEGKHSIAWYAKHTNERHKELKWCNQQPQSIKWLSTPAGHACRHAADGTKFSQHPNQY